MKNLLLGCIYLLPLAAMSSAETFWGNMLWGCAVVTAVNFDRYLRRSGIICQ